ncbi:MAG: DsbA family protein [Alphaproteobacteria bacterium]|nr:DsbA family protein [Alphaproteobacteria bacterium]
MPDVVHFGYWSDPLCIWAYVAQDKLDRVLEEFGAELAVDYRICPVFGSILHRFREGSWAAAGVPGRVEATRRVAAEHGHPEVSGEVWAKACPASSWPAGAAIKAVSDLEASELAEPGSLATYQWRLRQRFFIDEVDVSLRRVQLELAEELGIDRAALCERLDDGRAMAWLWEDHVERERLGLRGSPTFVFNEGRAELYGNFPFGILHATVLELVMGMRPGASAC